MRRLTAFASLLPLLVMPAGAPAARDQPDARDEAAAGAAAHDLDARLDRVSRRFLGAPYRLGPLGEEAPPDADPRFRLDVFDCTTYVETVLAISLAPPAVEAANRNAATAQNETADDDAAGATDGGAAAGATDHGAARQWLDRIRYTGSVPSFASRRHLIDSQWIPELIAAGLLRDVTREIGGRATRTGSLRLRRDAWERSSLARDHGLAWSAVPHGRHDLDYLPWHLLQRDQVRAALPPVAVLSLVATPHPDVPTLVTHQGLLLRGAGGEIIVRHASSRTGRVADEPLDRFVERSRALRRRTVLGVNVLVVVDPGRRPAD